MIRQDIPIIGGKQKVLVVRLDAVGDFILWLDAAKALRSVYPNNLYELHLVGNKAWCDLASTLNYFDFIWPLDRPSFVGDYLYRFSLLKRIRQEHFVITVHPVYSREFFLGDAIVRVSSASEKIGFRGDLSNTSKLATLFSNNWYTSLIPDTTKIEMELIRNAGFIRGLGGIGFRASIPDLKMLISNHTALKYDYPYYVIVPGAGMLLKKWPASSFHNVAIKIHNLTGWKGLVCGTAQEETLATTICQNRSIPVKNIVGKTSLLEFINIISRAKIVIGNDSAAIHIAAALSIPAVCIMGGGQFGRFFPYAVELSIKSVSVELVYLSMDCFGCEWKCRYVDDRKQVAPCVFDISEEMVLSRVKKTLRAVGEL